MAYLLHHLLSESAARYPQKVAITYKDEKITYAELERETSVLASALGQIGVERGDRVGIYMNRCIRSIVAAFGILKAGAAYVPIDPLCPPNRLSYIVGKCRIRFLAASREKLANVGRVFPEASPFKSILVMDGPPPDGETVGSAGWVDWQRVRETATTDGVCRNGIDGDVAYILFTSGSTGNPKGVVISHLNSLTFVNSAHDFFGVGPRDTFSNICPLHFDMSVFDLFVAIRAGASVAIVPEHMAAFPSQLSQFIQENRVSVWNSVPSALSLLATFGNLDRYDLSSLRLILFAGEVFPVKHLRKLRTSVPHARFYNIYGQTEANSSTYYAVDETPSDDTAVLPIGRALPNFEVFALDENGRRVEKPGERGELYVRASTVALGYWDDPERTAERFVGNPLEPDSNEKVYRTGDLVLLQEDGNYAFLGRKDHMIKSRGYRIEIGEIETVLSTHPGVKTAVVIPIPDELIGNRIAAAIVPCSGCAIEKADLIRYCAVRLPKYMIPEIIEFRDALPMTSSGKTDRRKLSGMLSGSPSARQTI